VTEAAGKSRVLVIHHVFPLREPPENKSFWSTLLGGKRIQFNLKANAQLSRRLPLRSKGKMVTWSALLGEHVLSKLWVRDVRAGAGSAC
jgi:hypothetical protein